MEAAIVAIASLIGSLLSLYLLVDAIRDRKFVSATFPPRLDLKEVATNQVIEEGVRLVVQLFFSIVALIAIYSDSEAIRSASVLLLITVPIILAGRSVYATVRRKRVLKENLENSGELPITKTLPEEHPGE